MVHDPSVRRQASFSEIAAALRRRSHLLDEGLSERTISRKVHAGSLIRLRRGWFLDGDLWRELWDESRHLALVIAVSGDAVGRAPVFSHASAAALWGLPWWGPLELRAHVLAGGAARCSSHDVFRHEDAVPDADVTERHGLRCTTLARTLADVARTTRAEAAIAVADAAFQRVAGPPRQYEHDLAERFRESMYRRLAVPGGRGIRIACRVIAIADGRADRPGESVSRLQLRRLGFSHIRPQVRVPGPTGDYWVDFAIDDCDAFGEFDGQAKYLDEAMRSGLSLDEVVMREKRREDWIRGATQRRFARWEAAHISSSARLGARLAAFGIRPSP